MISFFGDDTRPFEKQPRQVKYGSADEKKANDGKPVECVQASLTQFEMKQDYYAPYKVYKYLLMRLGCKSRTKNA